jgi:hypothetical protein
LALRYIPGAVKNKACPALKFDEDGTASCGLYLETIPKDPLLSKMLETALGFGEGCCTSAKAVNLALKSSFDFASLSPDQKRKAVKHVLINGGIKFKETA